MQVNRIDLANRLNRWGGLRSGKAGSPDVAPVAIVDDLRGSPFAPFAPWHATVFVSAVVAQLSYAAALNNSPATGAKAFVVVDFLVVRINNAAADCFAHESGAPFGFSNQGNAWSRASDSETNATAGTPLKDVVMQAANTATALEASAPFIPLGDTIGHRIDGPWVLAPGRMLIVASTIVNVALTAYFSGRFYAGT